MLAIRGAFSRFFAESGFFLAAGLAFFFLICCIPLTLLGVSSLGFVLSTERAADAVVGQLARNFPVYRREIAVVLLHIVETRALSSVTGMLVLLFFSTPLFGALRLVMHRMLGVRADGNYLRNLLLDAVLVILLTVLLFLASVLIAFVMFVYYTCIVFVFGAAYVASLEARRAARQ